MHDLPPPARARALRAAIAATLAACAWIAGPPQAHAAAAPPVPLLDWQPCHDGFQCATAAVPRDYDRPNGPAIQLALIRKPASDRAHRIGSLFLNPGGPGGSGVEMVLTAPPPVLERFSQRFDVVGFDPRGVGRSVPVIGCDPTPVYPYMTPDTLDVPELLRRASERVQACVGGDDASLLPYLTTGNVARDLDLLRAAVGDRKLTYFGASYGTMIGETYASLFPGKVRALALDSLLDGNTWLNHPIQARTEQLASFESSLDRFFTTCAAHQDVCRFGGDDPETAYDELLATADALPLPAPNATPPGVMTGDDLRALGINAMYRKDDWPLLADALSKAAAGDASTALDLGRAIGQADLEAPFLAYVANEARWPRDVQPYLDSGEQAFGLMDHFARGFFYEEVDRSLWPTRPRGAFYGPFRYPDGYPPLLVMANTHDPATPYAWARRFVEDLGNVRLLTFRADGHGAANSFDPCIVSALLAYLEHGTLPPVGATCQQHVPFG
jgi:pimeloyl-ACP methyl ester carboxylesterase